MTWLERLQPASFREVPFHVEAADLASGRRGADHVYPGRDEPYAEDAGRAPRQYHVTGYTIGEDYDLERNKLLLALEAEGPGTLVHPYFGAVQVVLRHYSSGMSTRAGGIAIFEMEFVEAGRNLVPVSSTDTAGVLQDAASGAQDALEESFAERFLADFPAWVTDAAIANVESVCDVLQDALAPITAIADGADDFRRGILDLRGEVGRMVLEPILLARRIRGLVNQYRRLPESTVEVFEGLIAMGRVAFGFEPITGSTSNRARQLANQRAVEAMVHRAALYDAAASISDLKLASRADVIAIRDLLQDAFETEILAAGDDPAQDGELRELERVFAAAMKDLAARDDGGLARLRTIHLPATQPALVLAHRLYQDANRDQEIIDRNRVPHPLFVPGGVPLEVLTSGG